MRAQHDRCIGKSEDRKAHNVSSGVDRIAEFRPARFRRAAQAGGLALLLLAGCKDSGLPHRNTPADQARTLGWRYTLYEQADPLSDRAAAIFNTGGERWITSGAQETIPATLLRPVATTQGIPLYALVWDQPPYTRLYVAGQSGRWRPLGRT